MVMWCDTKALIKSCHTSQSGGEKVDTCQFCYVIFLFKAQYKLGNNDSYIIYTR
jgi:hypothetical protein